MCGLRILDLPLVIMGWIFWVMDGCSGGVSIGDGEEVGEWDAE